ncbi:MAG TPA: HAD-IA family hydrolase [Caulobacteraceae bacterium]|jgi:putative hydrolase of the HAD superfamily|nr:HAD-IA family hydrolase [Caulobacteraceae bacterium]
MSTSPSQTQALAADSAPFQALVFDLGGVLVAHDNPVMYARLASRCAGGCSAETVVALLRQTDWSAGIPVEALHQQLRAELGYAPGWDDFVADWCCHFEVDHSMLAFVERLGAHNRVMLFSNTNRQHWEFLVDATDGRLARLEPYLSHEIGLTKPQIRSFEVVAEKAGIDPGRSVFFDDVAENVEGARRAGFQAELFENQAKLQAFLTAKGVRLG